jgi:hypothetical protein
MKLCNTDPMNACPVRATSFMHSHVALVSPGREGEKLINFITQLYSHLPIRQVSSLSVNYCVIYDYEFGASYD